MAENNMHGVTSWRRSRFEHAEYDAQRYCCGIGVYKSLVAPQHMWDIVQRFVFV